MSTNSIIWLRRARLLFLKDLAMRMWHLQIKCAQLSGHSPLNPALMATATSNCPLDTRIVIFGGYGCPFQSCHKMSDVYRSFRTSELSARSALGSSPVTSPSPSSIKDPPRSLQLLSSNAELNLPSSRMLPPRQNGMRRKAGRCPAANSRNRTNCIARCCCRHSEDA